MMNIFMSPAVENLLSFCCVAHCNCNNATEQRKTTKPLRHNEAQNLMSSCLGGSNGCSVFGTLKGVTQQAMTQGTKAD